MNKIYYPTEDIIEYLTEIKQDYSQKSSNSINDGYVDVLEYVIQQLHLLDEITLENYQLKASNRGLRLCKLLREYANGYKEEIICYFHKWVNEDNALIELTHSGGVFVVKSDKIRFIDDRR